METAEPDTNGTRTRRSWLERLSGGMLAKTSREESDRGLGTFQGVYRPTVLTILGVIMYLREGWIIGEAGLLGGLLIILATFFITGTAALSLSCITTNIHVGKGGVFSIISQSLGLESGGSIGIPLYLGQALSSALYIYGFTEIWTYLFPGHSTMLVAYCVFLVAFTATLVSTRLAFRLQGFVMIVILISLGSILMGATPAGGLTEFQQPTLWGAFDAGGFWILFAIFFPGGTGIKVGASMSGALEKPRISIPRGTLAAVGTALFVYVAMALWYALVVPAEVLRENRLAVVEYAAISELVIIGILASTFTATLSSLVAAPRVLQALGEQDIVPGARFLEQVSEDGEARNAILATGVLVASALLLGSLDRVAMLITMFFLLIYLTINLVVTVETALGMVSFRPTFKLPLWVPICGMIGSLVTLFIISPLFALIALTVIASIYVYLVKRSLKTPWQTVRSSIFVGLADWASKQIGRSPEEANERSWKPDLLVPVTSRAQIEGSFRFLQALAAPNGSIKIIGIRQNGSDLTLESGRVDTLRDVVSGFQDEELFATSVVLSTPSVLEGVKMSAAVLRGSAFRPNVLFGYAHRYDADTVQGFVDLADSFQMGAALYYEHPEAGLGQERRVTIWTSDRSPDWELGLRLANLDLSVLLGYQTVRNWGGRMRLATVCSDSAEVQNAQMYLDDLIDNARLPRNADTWVRHGNFYEQISTAPHADLNILGLPRSVDYEFIESVVQATESSCLFVRDSGLESALA